MPDNHRSDADELWRFALAFYAQPEIERVCLALQDEQGVDVVLLIGLLWLAARDGRAVGDSDIARLDAAIAGWRDTVVRPLRDLRRSLKARLADLPASAAETRNNIKAAELSAERVAVDLLAAAIAGLPEAGAVEERRFAAQRSVEGYLGWLGRAPTPDLRAATAIFLDGLSGMAVSG